MSVCGACSDAAHALQVVAEVLGREGRLAGRSPVRKGSPSALNGRAQSLHTPAAFRVRPPDAGAFGLLQGFLCRPSRRQSPSRASFHPESTLRAKYKNTRTSAHLFSLLRLARFGMPPLAFHPISPQFRDFTVEIAVLLTSCSQRWRTTSAECRERERLNADMYNDVRKASEIHRTVRKYIKSIAKPGIKIIEMAEVRNDSLRFATILSPRKIRPLALLLPRRPEPLRYPLLLRRRCWRTPCEPLSRRTGCRCGADQHTNFAQRKTRKITLETSGGLI